MATSHSGNDYERLKEELRGLKRRGAPWYFESALHQRLHGGGRRRPRRRPIAIFPVLAVAVVTLCILGLAVYVVMIRTNMVFPAPHEEGPSGAGPVLRAAPGDSARSRQERTPAAVKPPPRVTIREADAVRVPPDTATADSPAALRRRPDTADARRDTSSAVKDTIGRGRDTTSARNRTD